MARAVFSLTKAGELDFLSCTGEETLPWWPPRGFRTQGAPESLSDTLTSGAGGPAGRSRPVLTCFPSARFLLPSAQLSETLANFLPARVAVETDRKKGPGQSHPRAGEIMDHREDNASSRPQDSVPRAVNRKPCIGLSGRKSPPVCPGV